MDQTREEVDRLNEQAKSPVGAVRDIQNLTANTSASVEELREFVAGLKGRSPQEVLGMVTGSGLFHGVFHATIGITVLLAAFTVGPWLLRVDEAAVAEDVERLANAVQDQSAETQADDASATAAEAVADGSSAPDNVDPASAAAAMGIDEIKNADPDSNPLGTDAKLDNLLDGLN